MYGSLFWIDWLDRLDRVLTATRADVAALLRSVDARALERLERSKRQLSALTHDLRLLDRDVLSNDADRLQNALDAASRQLDTLNLEASADALISARQLGAIDAALRDSTYEAAMVLTPTRRRA